MRRLVWIISSLVLLPGVSIPSALPASAQANASAFTVSGKVTGGQGPVRVVLYLWPAQATGAALKPGQQVPLRVLASQTTGSGSYKLSFDPAALGVTAGGIVNMEVVASAGGAVDTYSFSRQLATDHAGKRVLAALSGEPQMAPQAANLPLSTKCGKRGQPYCQCPKGGFPDHVVFKKNLGEKSVIVGALYSRVRDITAEFSYKQGQSSSLGVAFSIGTADGSYSQAGTHSVSSSSGEDFPNFHGRTAHLYRTYFRYGKYRWRCDTTVNGVTKQVWGAWQVQADDFGGGASSPRLHQAPDAKFCVPQEAHSTFHKSTSVAYTFTKGANVSSNIGIDLSSQTGYDREASISYVVGSSGRLICGLKGPPGGSNPAPRLIVAGAK